MTEGPEVPLVLSSDSIVSLDVVGPVEGPVSVSDGILK